MAKLTVFRNVDDHRLVIEFLDVARLQVLLETEELLGAIEGERDVLLALARLEVLPVAN